MVPLILILLATAAAGVVAYGTHPDWIVHSSAGFSIITTSHRLQWPLTFLAILLCLGLVVLVAAGKRRIYWLLGLAPVIALLFHHFRADPLRTFAILDNPPFVPAAQAGPLVADDDYVVGLQLEDAAYAYPYALIYAYPAVLHVERGRRVLLMWSPFANRASAHLVDRDVRAGELAIVSMPANALLLYNSRLGQFINGVTGLTTKGATPTGFTSPIRTTKTTWANWRTTHPDTKVLAVAPRYSDLPRRPVVPYFKTPAPADPALAGTRVTLVDAGGVSPLVLPDDAIKSQPLNLSPDTGAPMVLFRDRSGDIRALDRRFGPDIAPEFRPISDLKRPNVFMVDTATSTGWTSAGRAVDGDQKFRGAKLTPLSVDDYLPYAVVKFWYPDAAMLEVKPEYYGQTIVVPSDPVPTSSRRRRPTR